MKLALILLLLIHTRLFSQDSTDKEKREIILEFIVGENLRMASESFFERQIQNIRQSRPELADSIWDNVRANLKEGSAFLDTVVQTYQSRFSLDELREIRQLLSTPTLVKVKRVGAEVGEMFPTMAVACGRKIMNRIKEYLDSHFPNPKK